MDSESASSQLTPELPRFVETDDIVEIFSFVLDKELLASLFWYQVLMFWLDFEEAENVPLELLVFVH